MKTWSRRAALTVGTMTLAGGAAFFAMRGKDRGGQHAPYFQALEAALKQARIAHPVLVVDKARLEGNIRAVRAIIEPSGLALRVVAKSLPAAGLLETVADGMATNRFMVFNGAMLEILAAREGADLLVGKPLPAMQFAEFIENAGPTAAAKVQWLIDTPARLRQYAEIAAARDMPLRANLELDVGLHRGGFSDPQALAQTLDLAGQLGSISISGLMGYDAHVPKMSNPEAAFAASQAVYGQAIDVLREKLAVDPATLTLNGAGSPTFVRHTKRTFANEVSVGSAFVKPVDFDLDSLAALMPASFIATPVIKAQRTELPGAEWLSGPMKLYDPNSANAYFIYGGHWLATPVSPPGLQYSELYGRSSNQEMLNGSTSVTLRPDDTVFLRPNQSEAVFLQFGDIAVFDGERITHFWPSFPVSA